MKNTLIALLVGLTLGVSAALLTSCGPDLNDCPTCPAFPDTTGDENKVGADVTINVTNSNTVIVQDDYDPAPTASASASATAIAVVVTPPPAPPADPPKEVCDAGTPPPPPQECEEVCTKKKKVLECEDGKHYLNLHDCRDKRCQKKYVCVQRELRCR